MAKKVEYIIDLKDKTVAKLGKLKKGLLGVGKVAKGVGKAFKGMALGATAFAGSAVVAGASFVKAYAQQQLAVESFNQALRNQGTFTRQASQEFQTFASEVQAVTTVGDEATLAMAAVGLEMGISEGNIKQASLAAIGLSEAYGVDLNSAMKLVAKANAGQTSELSRYGIVLDENLTDSEKFNEVLALGAEKFDTAKSKAETLTGEYTRLGNTVGDAKEEFGRIIADSLNLEDRFASLRLKIEELIKSGKLDVWANNIKTALKEAMPFLDATVGFVSKASSIISKGLGKVAEVGSGIGNVIAGGTFKAGMRDQRARREKKVEETAKIIERAEKKAEEKKSKSILEATIELAESRTNEAGEALIKAEEEENKKIEAAREKEAKKEAAKAEARAKKTLKAKLQAQLAGVNEQLDQASKTPDEKKAEKRQAEQLRRAREKVERERKQGGFGFKASRKDKELVNIADLEKKRADIRAKLATLEANAYQAMISLDKAIAGKKDK